MRRCDRPDSKFIGPSPRAGRWSYRISSRCLKQGMLLSSIIAGVKINHANGTLHRIALECELTGDAEYSLAGTRWAISMRALFPLHRNEYLRFVIWGRDAEQPVNAFLLQPLVYRLLQYAPVGAVKYLHLHHERLS